MPRFKLQQPMRRCAFLTMEDLTGFVSDDQLAVEPLRERGWKVDFVPWRAEVDWNHFDAVVIRTPWDYQDDPAGFLAVLEQITRSRARLENPLSLVRWNIEKSYLREMEKRGARLAPTLWEKRFRAEFLHGYFEKLRSPEIIIKPLVSANADDTYRLSAPVPELAVRHLEKVFAGRRYLVQRFLQSVVDEGEFSLFYFAGFHSHTILKTPKAEDFRVQEEHGGIIRAVEEADHRLLQTGARIMERIRPAPLYARVDLARLEDGDFALMELELIEPALYFRMSEGSAERFAAAFDSWMTQEVPVQEKEVHHGG